MYLLSDVPNMDTKLHIKPENEDQEEVKNR